ncbi:hypothetical protein A3B36_01795 [Candidatus Uhrbacteria bacterium RIFCSPLOWO2_01_FULL_55_36]|uniref:Plasmid stabilization system n=2 Tax=Parcubacteria group TaxID=1794811 RepID=A0A0G1WDP7_9BACT|nr:MAG: hypothetical protein UY58_C0016G0010 [Candidatus Magasanikbacteria bacterium GW2011_GWA2_50_22]OGL84237.1 MAG: hypothetical protein A3B36_01795 [Candidatus Uhrbacteria bacterium RIFCSPLOWO2_01_FULL_55_36]
MYKIEVTKAFQEDIGRLDRKVARLVLDKAEWIAEHPEAARFPLRHMPEDLRGLHKYRAGDYRMFFWIAHERQHMVLYRVLHRSEAYRQLGL